MNTKKSFGEENEIIALTDFELESACGGWSISTSFNPGTVNQFSYANSSFGNVSFGSLVSTQGNFQIGGPAQSFNYYNNGINGNTF